MTRRAWMWLGVLAIVALAVVGGAMAQQNESQVTICHRPPGNPENAQTITVGQSAVAAHQQEHGDTLGPCPASPSQPGRGRGDGRGPG